MLGAINSTDGATQFDGTCFGCGGLFGNWVHTPLSADGPGGGGSDVRIQAATQSVSPGVGVAPIRPVLPILGTMGAPTPVCGPCTELPPPPVVFKFVGYTAASVGTVGAGVGGYLGLNAGAAAVDAGGVEIISMPEVIIGFGLGGATVGGIAGLAAGAVLGLAVYGGYELYEYSKSQPAPQPIISPQNNSSGSGGGGL